MKQEQQSDVGDEDVTVRRCSALCDNDGPYERPFYCEHIICRMCFQSMIRLSQRHVCPMCRAVPRYPCSLMPVQQYSMSGMEPYDPRLVAVQIDGVVFPVFGPITRERHMEQMRRDRSLRAAVTRRMRRERAEAEKQEQDNVRRALWVVEQQQRNMIREEQLERENIIFHYKSYVLMHEIRCKMVDMHCLDDYLDASWDVQSMNEIFFMIRVIRGLIGTWEERNAMLL